ncbi:MAG: rRNA pseudouridine synthase [Oscillospiraceae bacterium]|nr:rRNA pseudouridine synthase [Oscillospiraceae bacterium]
MADDKIRLQKYLAECGIASRRKSEELIAAGKVYVNGKKSGIGDTVDPKKDMVSVDGRKVSKNKTMRYIMLYKPRGFITTMSDEQGRKCVAQLITDVNARVYPVGRLDRDSEGLLLITNDGEFANAMMHPARHVPKTYRVTVRPDIGEEQITKMMTGMMIDEKKTMPAEVKVILKESNRTVIEVVICEGRNRQIRKMCEELGLEVARLKRMAVGPVKLGMLQQGKWRDLSKQEVDGLLKAAHIKHENY